MQQRIIFISNSINLVKDMCTTGGPRWLYIFKYFLINLSWMCIHNDCNCATCWDFAWSIAACTVFLNNEPCHYLFIHTGAYDWLNYITNVSIIESFINWCVLNSEYTYKDLNMHAWLHWTDEAETIAAAEFILLSSY